MSNDNIRAVCTVIENWARVAGGATAPASVESTGAAAAPRGCYRTYVCFWTGRNFVGGPWNTNPVPSGECRPLDHAYSAYNNSRSWARFWEISYYARLRDAKQKFDPEHVLTPDVDRDIKATFPATSLAGVSSHLAPPSRPFWE
jgi:hypothetical protein